MKKVFSLILSVSLVFSLSACGANGGTATGEQAPSIPEECRLYYDYAGLETIANADSKLPYAALSSKGVPEGINVALPNGSKTDLIMREFQDGVTLEDATGGKAVKSTAYGGLIWNGEMYNTYTINVSDGAVLPGLNAYMGGILILKLSGDCTVDNARPEESCFTGFDCVVIAGEGTLRQKGGVDLVDGGGGELPIPSCVLCGPTVACRSLNLAPNAGEGFPTYLQTAGTMQTGRINVTSAGDICVAGGTLSAGTMTGSIRNAVFRDGLAFIETLDPYQEQTIIMSGAKAYFSNEIDVASTVLAGAGEIAAQGITELAKLKKYDCAVLNTDTDASPFYGMLPSDAASFVTAQSLGGVSVSPCVISAPAENMYFGGKLQMNGASVARIAPWCGLWLELDGANTVSYSGEEKALGAPAILLTGSGSLDVKGNAGIWAGGTMNSSCFVVRGPAVNISGAQECFVMGSESGGEDIFLLDGGSIDFGSDVWMQNAALTVEDGELTVNGNVALEGGKIVINGGTFTVNDLYLASGEIVVNGGTLIVSQGVTVDNGNITVSGGEVIIPGGQQALNAANGTVNVTGGTVREA